MGAHFDTPSEIVAAEEDLHAEFMAYEIARREELFRIARQMTEIGMAGADPYEPWVANYLTRAINATDGDPDALREYNLKNWKGR